MFGGNIRVEECSMGFSRLVNYLSRATRGSRIKRWGCGRKSTQQVGRLPIREEEEGERHTQSV